MASMMSRVVFWMSHPAWGEWIEIASASSFFVDRYRLTPHGVSGLKSSYADYEQLVGGTHPAWGEWIEISSSTGTRWAKLVSPRMG